MSTELSTHAQHVRASARAAAEACVEQGTGRWWSSTIMPSEIAFSRIEKLAEGNFIGPDHAAYFLLIVGESYE